MKFQSTVADTSWLGQLRTPPQKHRLAEAGGDLWRSSSPSLLITQEQLEATCHHLKNVSKDRGSTTFLGSLCLCLVTLTGKKSFLDFRGRDLIQSVPIGSFPATECSWEGSSSILFAFSSQVLVYISETPPGHSVFQANQKRLSEPLHL